MKARVRQLKREICAGRERANKHGRLAKLLAATILDCPWKEGTLQYDAFMEGYRDEPYEGCVCMGTNRCFFCQNHYEPLELL